MCQALLLAGDSLVICLKVEVILFHPYGKTHILGYFKISFLIAERTTQYEIYGVHVIQGT